MKGKYMKKDEVKKLNKTGLRLAQFTVGYNLVEAIISISAGLTAGLISMVGFGFDAGIELASGVIVITRIASRLKNKEADERKERLALKAIAITFFVLATYVTVRSIISLAVGEEPDNSVVSICLLVASLIIMPFIASQKRKVGKKLGDNLLLADAAETKVCVLLTISTLIGLIFYAIFDFTWIDPVLGLMIAVFAVREGIEAWKGELVEDEEEAEEEAEEPIILS
jgi:divalent metal cation (Fe/Co/Zn/Cd) transporter